MFKFGNLTYDVFIENKLVSDVNLNDIIFEKCIIKNQERTKYGLLIENIVLAVRIK